MAAKKPKFPPKLKISEKVFQKNIMRTLKMSGYMVYKQNVFSGYVGTHFLSSGIPEGASDLIVLAPPLGVVLFVELKSTSGKQRDSQKLFEKEVLKRGGIYLLLTAKDSIAKNLELVKLAVERKCEEIATKFGFKLHG